MADSKVGIALILSAYDKASSVINGMTTKAISQMKTMQKKSSELANASFTTGKDLAAAGIAAYVPVKKTISAFEDLEDAQLALKSTMMDAQGRVASEFERVNKLAIDLGNELPGNTADFYNMFDVMMRNGARANDILSGTGRAAAYLAVQLKIPYDAAAQFAQRLQVSTGVANSDMMAFMDTLARVKQLGPDVDEMQYAFQRSAGQLKMMKIQGLEAMNQLSPAFAILVKTMGSGERVGTNFSAMLASFGDAKAMKSFKDLAAGMGIKDVKFVDKNGDFLGIENMMQQFDKMRGLATNQKQKLINALVGSKGGDTQIMSTLIDGGIEAYRKMQEAMKNQADLNAKVNLQLQSFKNKWDAVEGTMVNVAAAAGEKLAPEFKGYFDMLNNKILPKISLFIEKHPKLVGWMLKSLTVFAGLSLAGSGLAFMFGGLARGFSLITGFGKGVFQFFKLLQFGAFALRYHFVTGLLPAISKAITVFRAFSIALLTNPFTYIVLGAVVVAGAAYYVIKHWDAVKKFFVGMWNFTKAIFKVSLDCLIKIISNFTPVGLIFSHWSAITDFFKNLWDNVKGIFLGYVAWTMNLGKTFWNAGVNIVKSIWEGIKSMADKPIEAIRNIVKGIRDHLPFSPAKVGPLRDIHRIKLVETIAASIKPKALVNAWQRTLGTFTSELRRPSPIPAAAGVNGQVIQFTYSPTIHINGGASPADAQHLAKDAYNQFVRFMKQYDQQRNRTSFNG